MDFGSYAGYGIPYHVVTARDAALDGHLRLRRRVRPRRLPDPGEPADRGRLGPPHPHGRQGRLPPLRAVRRPQGRAARWYAGSGATWDLRSNALRPAGWTSADAAGLPILPGLVRYDEVAAGAIRHALRFTTAPDPQRATSTRPATRPATSTSSSLPPMGLRVRLKASFDTVGLLAARAGHRRGAQALRDDPRRQRLALVHHRRQRPALRRRRPARARRHHRARPRGRRHERAGQRVLPCRARSPMRRRPSGRSGPAATPRRPASAPGR